ncbi:MAG: hypothetical protein IAC58_04020 [Firmicutes bacterium]|uniref:Lipoprotein n=1 Tax=Candidatus Onthovivens merdipullorum TaxID=2840889 RepID=A0A9D9GXB5_9BACL|nr:hypothetical protein [Candidatus Onthovivens merdipullorum]
MKKKLLLAQSLVLALSFGGLLLTGCGDDSQTENQVTSTRLVLDTTNVKKDFIVGEGFTAKNLLVYEVETIDGVDGEKVLTANYSLSIEEGQILDRDDTEVIVRSTKENVRSSSYEINVTSGGSGISLSEKINEILTKRSYTVNTRLSAYNNICEIKGRVVDTTSIDQENGYTGVSWTGDTSGIYPDSDVALNEGRQIGYGEYNGETFQYVLNDEGEISSTTLLSSMGGYAKDAGILNYNDSRDSYQARISTYNIFYGLEDVAEASNELEYIENLEPYDGSTYRFYFDDETLPHKWIFGLTGDPYASYNPAYTFEDGYADITTNSDGTLTIETYEPSGEVPTLRSTVSLIGETHIEELETFLENPDFGFNGDETLAEISNTFSTSGNNVLITDTTNADSPITIGVINDKYVYGVERTLEASDESGETTLINPLITTNNDFIYLSENNTLGLEPAYYWYNKTLIGEETEHIVSTSSYSSLTECLMNGFNPRTFSVLANAYQFFDTEVANETYVYTNPRLSTSDTNNLYRLLGLSGTNYSISELVLTVDDLENSTYSLEIHGVSAGESAETLIGKITFSDFGSASLTEAEEIYNSYNNIA